jgi:hypothetical protein
MTQPAARRLRTATALVLAGVVVVLVVTTIAVVGALRDDLPSRDADAAPGSVENPVGPGESAVGLGSGGDVTVDDVRWDDSLAFDVAVAPGSGEAELEWVYVQPDGTEFPGPAPFRVEPVLPSDGPTRIASNVLLAQGDVVDGGVLRITDRLTDTSVFVAVPVPLPQPGTPTPVAEGQRPGPGSVTDPLPHSRTVRLAGGEVSVTVVERNSEDVPDDTAVLVVLSGRGGDAPLVDVVDVAFETRTGLESSATEVTEELPLGAGSGRVGTPDRVATYTVELPGDATQGALRVSDGEVTAYFDATPTG